MFHRSSTLALLLPALLFLSACSKDKDDAATPSGGGTTSPLPGHVLSLGLSYSRFGALSDHSAVGLLLNAAGQSVAIDSISVNGITLVPGVFDPTLLQTPPTHALNVFSDPTQWFVSIADSLPTLQATVPTTNFPVLGDLTSPTTLQNDQPYVITMSNVQHADSTVFALGSYAKVIPGSPASCAFSLDEVSQLAEGNNEIIVFSWRREARMIQGIRVQLRQSYQVRYSIEIL